MKLIYVILFSALIYAQGDKLLGSLNNPSAYYQSTYYFAKGYDELMQDNYIKDKSDKINVFINSTRKAIDIYGRIKGFEPSGAEKLAPSYVRVTYIEKYSRFPLRCIFTFYNSPEKGWIITNVKFDDDSATFFLITDIVIK